MNRLQPFLDYEISSEFPLAPKRLKCKHGHSPPLLQEEEALKENPLEEEEEEVEAIGNQESPVDESSQEEPQGPWLSLTQKTAMGFLVDGLH